MTTAFDTIATVTPKKAATTKIAAQVTPEIKNKVDTFVTRKAQLKQLESEQKILEDEIINYVQPQQDNLAYNGTFTKSLEVSGNQSRILYSTSDRFSVPQEPEAIDELRKITKGLFQDMFEVTRTITLKSEVLKNEELLSKIANACSKAGLNIADIFLVGDKWVAKENLDEKQYKLSPKNLSILRTLVKQNKPALKG